MVSGVNNNSVAANGSPVWRGNNFLVFGVLWVILFILYFRTIDAGWVSDVDELLYRIYNGRFRDYINAKLSRGNLYQVSWIAFYALHRLYGISPWLCNAVLLSFQAANATFIFNICGNLFHASGVKHSFIIAAGGALLFCICPHISEVVVWKAAFHYILAMLLMLCVLYNTQQFLSGAKGRYVLLSLVIFLVSSFSHEFFYLTPFFVLTMVLYYRYALGHDPVVCRKAILQFFLPLCGLVALHQLLLTINSGAVLGTLDSEVGQPVIEYLRKPPLYLFHTVFFGRYFPGQSTRWVYSFFSSWPGIAVFYSTVSVILLIAGISIFPRSKKGGKVTILIFCWMAACLALVSPMWLPDTMLITFDRYSYYMLPFLYLLLMFLIMQLPRVVAVGLLSAYCLVNVCLTWKVNTYWYHSSYLSKRLAHCIPAPHGKTILLLNIPEYINGASIYGPWWHFSFQQMYNLYNNEKITSPMHDVVSYNMVSPGDGAHVTVINDTVVHVTLNQWGTWWWANLNGAYSYQHKDYKFNLTDPGHDYELILRRPASAYLLLYQVGDQWKTVDMTKIGQEQY